MTETEKEIRERISQEIMAIDLSEGKQISSDWYAAALRTRLVCYLVAQKGLSND